MGHPIIEIGSIPMLHSEVSLGKILNPILLPMAVPSVCECMR